MAELPVRVFLSYSSADIECVNELYDAMSQHRTASGALAFDVFQDEKKIDIGEDWKARLRTELRAADCVMLVWSTHSAGSSWALQEATYAAIEDKLTGLLIERNISPPDLLSNANAVRYFTWSAQERAARIAKVCEQLLDRTRARRGVVSSLHAENEVTRVNREPQDRRVIPPCMSALKAGKAGCTFLLPAHDLEYPDDFALRYAHYILPGAIRQLDCGKALLQEYTPAVIDVFPNKRQTPATQLLEDIDASVADKLDQPGQNLGHSLNNTISLFPVLYISLPTDQWCAADTLALQGFVERLAKVRVQGQPRRFFTVFIALWYDSAQPPSIPAQPKGLFSFFSKRVSLDESMGRLGERTPAHFVQPLEKIQWADVASWRDDYRDQLPDARFRTFRNAVRAPYASQDTDIREHYADIVDPLTKALRSAIAYDDG